MWRDKLFVLSAAMLAVSSVNAEERANAVGLVSSNNPAGAGRFWERERLSGDWDGWRARIEDGGVDFSPVFTTEVFGDVSGGEGGSGVVYDHCLTLPLTLDLEQLAGWKSATLHANAFWIAGRSLSEDCVGDIGNVSNISADPAFRLQELWLQQEAFRQTVSIRAGLIAVDNEFFTSDSAALFLNGSFGAFPLVGANLPNPPIYPMAAPAIRLRWQPAPRFYWQTAVLDGNSGSQEGNPNGVNFPLAESDGALFFSEIGFLPPTESDANTPARTVKAGGFVLTKRVPDWSSQTGGDPGGGQINFGVYGVVEQELFKRHDRKVTAFARGGYAPANRNVVDWYFDAGFNVAGLVPGRTEDVAGIALARSGISRAYSDYEQAVEGTAACNYEMVVEAIYRAQITPAFALQPDFQCVVAPGGDCDCRNAVVVGLRATMVF